jgi:hypothetical protein
MCPQRCSPAPTRTLLSGAAAWPFAAHAQQPDRRRRIGVLIQVAEGDPQARIEVSAFVRKLQELGWNEGRNLQIDIRWALCGLRADVEWGPDRERSRSPVWRTSIGATCTQFYEIPLSPRESDIWRVMKWIAPASALAAVVAGVALIADAKAVTVDIAAGPNGWGCTTCFGGPPSVYNPPFSSPGGPGLLVTLVNQGADRILHANRVSAPRPTWRRAARAPRAATRSRRRAA